MGLSTWLSREIFEALGVLAPRSYLYYTLAFLSLMNEHAYISTLKAQIRHLLLKTASPQTHTARVW